MRQIQLMILICLLLCTDSVCQMASTSPHANKTPAEVVQQYCTLDLSGARVGGRLGTPRIFKLVTWKTEPGWDTFTVVRGYRLVDTRKTASGTEVRVEYQALGQISANTLDRKAGIETVTFVLETFGGAWKIAKPVFQPHLSVEGAIAAQRQALGVVDSESDKKQVEATLRQLEALRTGRTR
jgi:hypothetical protein